MDGPVRHGRRCSALAGRIMNGNCIEIHAAGD